MVESIFFLILLVGALALGWGIARWQNAKEIAHQERRANRYFQGLNYLLNEEPDKAIEIFLQLAEKKPSRLYKAGRQASLDVIDTHLALGSLFRRRGEMDKAIRFHKHIIAQPHLTESQRIAALKELGRDYLQAGLLDRAERLFSELIERQHGEFQPTRQLMDIYQQEKDWEKAITQAQRLKEDESVNSEALLAQFYCELADQARRKGDMEQVQKALRQARRYRPSHPRASMIGGEVAWSSGDMDSAIAEFSKACESDPDVFVLVGDRLREAHEHNHQVEKFIEWLESFYARTPTTPALIMLATLQAQKDPSRGVATLLDGLEKRPTIRGLDALVSLLHSNEMSLSQVNPDLIGQLMKKLKDAQARYQCKQCGFSSSEHHWMCPSCRHWDTTRLIQGPWGD